MQLNTYITVNLFFATAALGAVPAGAQQMYKCGNTYSQIPCDKAAEPVKITKDARSTPPPGPIGKELCKAIVPRTVALKDPYSAQIESVGDHVSEVIRIGAEPVVARRFDVAMNAKNTYGAYTGAKVYRCYLSEDQTRVLLVVPPPNS